MITVKFIDVDGNNHEVQGDQGQSLMEVAVTNIVPGIIGDCGGACACATCHVYVNKEWVDQLEPAGELENSMLEYALDVQPNSRLGCQIKLKEALEGITLHVPPNQL